MFEVRVTVDPEAQRAFLDRFLNEFDPERMWESRLDKAAILDHGNELSPDAHAWLKKQKIEYGFVYPSRFFFDCERDAIRFRWRGYWLPYWAKCIAEKLCAPTKSPSADPYITITELHRQRYGTPESTPYMTFDAWTGERVN